MHRLGGWGLVRSAAEMAAAAYYCPYVKPDRPDYILILKLS